MLSMRKASTLVTVTILNPCGRAKPTRTFTQVTTPLRFKPSCNHLVRSCCLYDLVYVNVLPSIPNHLVQRSEQKSFTPPGKTLTRCIVVTLITRAQSLSYIVGGIRSMQILDSLLTGHLRDEAAYCHGVTDHHLSTEYHACSSYFVYLTLA